MSLILAELAQMQKLPLHEKVRLSIEKIRTYIDNRGDLSYVAFSGGKDSTVLLDLVRKVSKTTTAVFCNTGLEFPEIVEFAREQSNVVTIRPKLPFQKVLEKYGYPIISKQVSMGISRYRNTSCDIQKDLRKNGGINPTSGKKQRRSIPLRYQYLIDAPFKISEACCDVMKKGPMKAYGSATKKSPIIGTMASDSRFRKLSIERAGCVTYNHKSQTLTPLAFWTEADIWEYIEGERLPYSSIYDMGYSRTGCMFCMFGIMEEKSDRFKMMKNTHPRQYDYCMDKLGVRGVLEYIAIGKTSGVNT
jgi:3'-phosphoadenosine 5'-phosphosulfate sulfotransferase (PAPS reductase)/FAD synthetase